MNTTLLRPIKISLLYLFFTLIVYLINYGAVSTNLFLTVVYCGLNFFMLWLGYIVFIPKTKDSNQSLPSYPIAPLLNKIIFWSALITMIVSFNNIYTFYKDVDNLFDFILNPGKAYEYVKFVNRHATSTESSLFRSVIAIFLNICTVAKYFLFTFVFLYWKGLKKGLKIFSAASIFLYFIHCLLIGAMINIGVVLFSVLPILLSLNLSQQEKGRTNRKKFFLWILIAAAVITLAYFLGNRSYIDTEEVGFFTTVLNGFRNMTSYLSQGYYGLSTCFNLDFDCTLGTTTFRGLSETILPYLGVDVSSLFSNSYLMKNQMEYGWQALQTWSTIFPWLASDFSFYLVPLIFALIGYQMKKVWQNCLRNHNPFAYTLMGQVMIFVFMIPANNQLMHTFSNAMSFFIILCVYLASSRKQAAIPEVQNS